MATTTTSIYLYNGNGASSFCVSQTKSALENALDMRVHTLIEVDEFWLQEETDWLKSRAVLVFPGGTVVGYEVSLRKIAEKIQSFVKEGGKFFGICAGAIFASQQMQIDIGERKKAKLPMALQIGNCIAKWPTFKDRPLTSNSHIPSRGAEIILSSSNTIKVYWNLGPYFNEPKNGAFEVLGRYAHLNKPSMIFNKYGNGSVLLTAVHAEINSESLKQETENDPVEKIAQQRVIQELNGEERAQAELFRFFCEKLDLALKS